MVEARTQPPFWVAIAIRVWPSAPRRTIVLH
jgi:hypothetical protein